MISCFGSENSVLISLEKLASEQSEIVTNSRYYYLYGDLVSFLDYKNSEKKSSPGLLLEIENQKIEYIPSRSGNSLSVLFAEILSINEEIEDGMDHSDKTIFFALFPLLKKAFQLHTRLNK